MSSLSNCSTHSHNSQSPGGIGLLWNRTCPHENSPAQHYPEHGYTIRLDLHMNNDLDLQLPG